MDIIDITLAAKKAIAQLEDSGKVAKTRATNTNKRIYCTPEPNEEMGGLRVAMVEGTLGIKETDNSFTIDFRFGDGMYYNLVERTPVTSPIWAGNLGLAGMGDDTGEFICVGVDFDNNMSLVISAVEGTVELWVDTYFDQIESTIDPKYLPGVCLPMVELTEEQIAEMVEIPGTYVRLSQDGQDALNRASSLRIPVIVFAEISNGSNIAPMEDQEHYRTTINKATYMFSFYDGYWSCSVTV